MRRRQRSLAARLRNLRTSRSHRGADSIIEAHRGAQASELGKKLCFLPSSLAWEPLESDRKSPACSARQRHQWRRLQTCGWLWRRRRCDDDDDDAVVVDRLRRPKQFGASTSLELSLASIMLVSNLALATFATPMQTQQVAWALAESRIVAA